MRVVLFATAIVIASAVSASAVSDMSSATLSDIKTRDDYPADAMRNREQGTTRVALAIDVTGHISNCRVVGSSGSASLDATTCKLFIRRARFQPARDEKGQAVEQMIEEKVKWVLPPR